MNAVVLSCSAVLISNYKMVIFRDGLMTVSGRKHNTDDIIATVLAVEPMRFIYRGRIAVFSVKVSKI